MTPRATTEVRVARVTSGRLTGRWHVQCVIPCRCRFELFVGTQAEAMDAARHRTARPAHTRWREAQPTTTTTSTLRSAA